MYTKQRKTSKPLLTNNVKPTVNKRTQQRQTTNTSTQKLINPRKSQRKHKANQPKPT